MTNILEIDRDIYNILIDSFGENTLREKMDDILLSAIENLLEKYTREILEFEERYGVSFEEFEKMWDEGKIDNKHDHEIEGDFIDWEMLEMEKKGLLSALSRLKSLRNG